MEVVTAFVVGLQSLPPRASPLNSIRPPRSRHLLEPELGGRLPGSAIQDNSENPRLFRDCFVKRLDDASLHSKMLVIIRRCPQGIEIHFRGWHEKREVAR